MLATQGSNFNYFKMAIFLPKTVFVAVKSLLKQSSWRKIAANCYNGFASLPQQRLKKLVWLFLPIRRHTILCMPIFWPCSSAGWTKLSALLISRFCPFLFLNRILCKVGPGYRKLNSAAVPRPDKFLRGIWCVRWSFTLKIPGADFPRFMEILPIGAFWRCCLPTSNAAAPLWWLWPTIGSNAPNTRRVAFFYTILRR